MIKTLVLLSASLAACAGQAEIEYGAGAPAPELVAMDTDPSVMIVANADEPTFYTDQAYWLYRDDHWYRSSRPRSGWARVDQPPAQVRRIDRPAAYVHFRRDANAPRTTYNEHQQVPQPQRPDRPRGRRDQPLPGPAREPNSQGPTQPYPNPLPPHQVPPVDPGQHDGPDHQIAPDPDRAPTEPDRQDRARDQRPEADRDHRRDAP